MGVRGPSARPRRLLASVWAWALAPLLALLVPGARALDECSLYSQDGVEIDDIYWDTEMLSLSQGTFATESLHDDVGPNIAYYKFKTDKIASVQINPLFYKDAKYFEAYLEGENLVIATSEFFDDIEKDLNRDTKTAVFLMLEIGCGSTGNVKRLQLDLEMLDTNNWHPDATQTTHSLTLPVPVNPGTNLLTVEGFDYDMTGRGVEVFVEVDNAQYKGLFSASASSVVDRGFTVTLSSAMEIRVKESVSFTLLIKDLGTNDDPERKESTVRVTFTPDLENSVFSPRFEQALYTANVRDPEAVSPGGAVLGAAIAFEEGFANNLNLALQDGDMHSGVPATEFVEVVRAGQALELRWKATLDPDRLAAFLEQPYALLLLTATAPNAPQPGRTVVHLALPGAYTGTPEPSLPTLSFEDAPYSKHLNRDDPKGELVVQPRLSNPGGVSGVRYSLENVADFETSPLGLLAVNANTGAVTLNVAPPPAGTYLYHIVARANGANPAQAQLLVLGPTGAKCNEESDEFCFSNAVSAKRIKEEEEQEVLAAMRVEGCTFTALSGQEYFTVNRQTGAARMRAVDREDEAFNGAEAPVLRLVVHSSCDNLASTSPDARVHDGASRADSNSNNWAILLGDVAHEPHTTVVMVEILDINDNKPVFNPSSIVVGFPDVSLAERLRLPALFTAQATDRDVGWNAQLRYSLDEAGAAVLQVDADSGAVYPRSDVPPPASGQRIVVRATDQQGTYGAQGTQSGTLDVTLVALAEEHLVEVHVEDALPEEVEQLLRDGAGSARELRLLSATVLPGDGSRADAPLPHLLRVRRAPQQDNSQDEDDGEDGDGNEDGDEKKSAAHLRVVLYSLRNGSPEVADQFKNDVEEQLKSKGWDAKADTPQLSGGGGGGGGDAGLLAAVITLAVLLGLLLVAAGIVGYWFGVRPRMAHGKRLSNSNGSPSQLSVVDIEPLRDEMLKKPPSPTMSFGDDRGVAGLGLAPPPEADAVRPSVMLGLPGEAAERDAETDDYMPTPSEGYEHPRPASEHPYEELLPVPAADTDVASVTSDPPPRKSVFFNEEVDCIEIRM